MSVGAIYHRGKRRTGQDWSLTGVICRLIRVWRYTKRTRSTRITRAILLPIATGSRLASVVFAAVLLTQSLGTQHFQATTLRCTAVRLLLRLRNGVPGVVNVKLFPFL